MYTQRTFYYLHVGSEEKTDFLEIISAPKNPSLNLGSSLHCQHSDDFG